MSDVATKVAMITLPLSKLRAISPIVRSSTLIALHIASPLLAHGWSSHRLLALVAAKVGLCYPATASLKALVPQRPSRPFNLFLLHLVLKDMAFRNQLVEVRDLHIANCLLNL